eukprot:Opistho-2@40979
MRYLPTLSFVITDVMEDIAGKVFVLFSAIASGIDPTTMRMIRPRLLSGSNDFYDSQFAGGWSSFDHYGDAYIRNCAEMYGASQSYANCWYYNLSSDGDSDAEDSRWGPHVAMSLFVAPSPIPTFDGLGGGVYSRVNRITRYVRVA